MEIMPAEQEKKTDGLIVLKPSPNNKDVIQSYILTSAKYDFSVYEKRILYRIVECFQSELAGKKLDKDFSVSPELFGDVLIEISFSLLLGDRDDKNHNQIKKALYSLLDKKIIRENGGIWQAFTLIVKPEINKYSRTIQFRLHKEVYEALLDFTKGYRKYELKTAMAFKSIYAMRFYELLSGQETPLTYSIENLKSMFQLENKYKRATDFIKYVIEPAKKELDTKSPYSFTYQLEYEKERINPKGGRRKITGITFIPVYHKENRNIILEYKENRRNLDLSDVLLDEELSAFLSLGFNENELKNKYYDLLIDMDKARHQGKTVFTPTIVGYAQTKKNPKTYAIKALRKEIVKWKEELSKQKLNKLSKQTQEEVHANRQEKNSVYSFLKNMLGFEWEELEDAMTYIMDHGGSSCLDEIFRSCNQDIVKTKKAIRKNIQSREQRKKDFKDVIAKKNEESEDILKSIPVPKSEDGSHVRRFLRNGMERIRKFFTKKGIKSP